jgi:DNA-binding response OmpR family regulator
MLSGSRVLIADDDPDVLAAVAESLEQLDANVVRANSATRHRLADNSRSTSVTDVDAVDDGRQRHACGADRRASHADHRHDRTLRRDDSGGGETPRSGYHAAAKPFEIQELESMAEAARRRRRPDVAD